MIENLSQIKQAIEIEQKHLYINIRGKESTFADFILKQLNFFYKKSKKKSSMASTNKRV